MDQHRCKAIVLHCMDYRLQAELRRFLTEDLNLDGRYDAMALGGSCQPLARPSDAPGKELILHEIGLCVSLHGTREAILINHQNCGAYLPFADAMSERVQHEADLQKARQVIQSVYPDLDVRLFFATFTEKGNERTIVIEPIP